MRKLTTTMKTLMLLAAFIWPALSVMGQTVIAVQDFDSGSPEWTYTNDIPFFDNTWGGDGYYGIIAFSSATPLDYANFSGSILGENDLDDEGDNGTTGFATLSMGTVDISSYTNVEITFDYDVVGYNANSDDAKYIVYFDGTPQTEVMIVDGGVDPTDGEGTITISVPAGTNSVALDIAIRDNGSSGYSGFDNIEVKGTLVTSNDADSYADATGVTQPTGSVIPSTNWDASSPVATPVFQFNVADAGTSDGLPTEVTAITIKAGDNNTAVWTEDIGGGYLYKESSGSMLTIGTEPSVTASSVTFYIEDGELDIADGGSELVTLYVWPEETTIDNAVIECMIDADAHGFAADAAGSAFATDFGADVTGEQFTIGVDATELSFITEPSDVEVGQTMAPVEVGAVDVNGNLDIDDSNTDITLTFSGSGTMSGTNPVQTASGVATFSDLSFDTEEAGVTLEANGGSFAAATSAAFNVMVLPDVFISEYIEGSSNNKAIEIYNGSGSDVDLSAFSIMATNNGDGIWDKEKILSGILVDGEVFVASTDAADQAILDVADVTYSYPSPIHYNGNDAVGLFYQGILIDIIGVPTEDEEWEVAGVTGATGEHTLVRKYPDVTTGNTDWASSAGTNTTDSEWEVYEQDNFSYIGWHEPLPIPVVQNITITPELVTVDDAISITADITDADGTISAVTLNWGTTTGTLGNTINMNVSSGDTYVIDTDIPAQTEGTTVYFEIVAEDDASNVTTTDEQSFDVIAVPTEVADIATLRAGATDGTVYKLTGEAILTFQQSYRGQKYIQDGTAGILIDDDAGTITSTYNLYDGIIDITGTLSEYGGMLQFVPVVDPGAANSSGNTLTPEVVEIPNVNTTVEDYEAELVTLEGVTFADAGATFSTGTPYDLSDGTNTIVFYTNYYDADYIGTTIPSGPQNVTAIVLDDGGTAQVFAREAADIVAAPTNDPVISNIVITPDAPTSSDAVSVAADVTDSDGTISSVTLNYGTTSGDLNQTINMSVSTDNTYVTDSDIPAQADGTTVYFEIVAEDDDANQTVTSEQSYTVSDGGAVTVADIATLRDGAQDGTVYELTGEAILTYQQSYRNKKYIQDGTAAIEIDDNAGTITTSYNWYDGITGITGTLSEYGGMLQFVPEADPGAASTTGSTLDPEVVMITDVNSAVEDYEAELVTLEGVTFADAGGTFATGTAYSLSDGTNTIEFYTNFYDADYIGTTIPSGPQNVTAIVIDDNGTAQVTSREAADIEAAATNDPVISNLMISPEEPESTDDVTVSAEITDADGSIATATIYWGTASGDLPNDVSMTVVSGDTYEGIIPAQPDGTSVFYKVEAMDNDDNITTSVEKSYIISDQLSVTFFTEPFDDGTFGNMTTYSAVGDDQIWEITQDFGNEPPSAKMTGYDGENFANEDWLITPQIDLSAAEQAKFFFDEAINFAGSIVDEQQVLISTDYTGSGDPNAATWTTLTLSGRAEGTNWEWYSVHDVFLTDYLGESSVYIAFKYISSDSDGATWEVDNVTVTGEVGIFDHALGELSVYPNPVQNELFVNGINGDAQVDIISIDGKVVMNKQIDSNRVDVASLNEGLYIIRVTNNNEVYTTRFVKE